MRQTMKKCFIFMASAALMLAASCNKMEEVNTPVEPVVETELITVELNPMTKTALGAEGATTWSAGDKVSVTVDDEHIGDLTLVEGSTFSGELVAGKSGEALLHYPSGVTEVPAEQTAVAGSFADDAALLDGTTTMDDLRNGTAVTLSNSTALLQFTVAQAGDVTFEVGDTDYTVTGCETGKTYYACVDPAEGVSFVARIGGYLSKQASSDVTFTANKIAPLGELPAPVEAAFGVIGSFQGWSTTSTSKMYVDVDDTVLAKNIELYKNDQYKIYGLDDDSWHGNGEANMTIDKNGLFDITFNTDTKAITATCVEEYTDLKVRIYVDNQKGWNPLNIHCWIVNGDADIPLTEWPGIQMTKDSSNEFFYYEIDGKYIGSQIGYVINNGTDQTDNLYQTLTPEGFTYVLPNEICKLIVKVNKSIDWYNKYLYSWTSDGDLTGSWPGTKMSYDKEEGNYYVYHYDYPGTLDGQTINYIINGNGSGQTKDLTVKLSKTQATTVTIEKTNLK